jgi:hypothetical protein
MMKEIRGPLLPRARTVVPNVSDEDIIRLIAFALSCVESGELKLPGEVGRGGGETLVFQDGSVRATLKETFIPFVVNQTLGNRTPLRFIALRPEEKK